MQATRSSNGSRGRGDTTDTISTRKRTMKQPDLLLEAIRAKPIFLLSIAEMAMLPDDERTLAVGLLLDAKRDGSLAMFKLNAPGTKYEVVADRELGWRLQTLCVCPRDQPNFIEALRSYRPESFSNGNEHHG